MKEVREAILATNWRVAHRTHPRPERMPETALGEAARHRDAGRFDMALAVYLSQPRHMLDQDPVALNGMGHAHLGLGDNERALDCFRDAAGAALLHQAKALTNQAHALRGMKRFEEAEQAARQACEIKPDWFLPYLMWIAILEWRGEEGDRLRVREVVEQMKERCPDWYREEEFWTYILDDVDYRRLREPGEFEVLFGKDFRKFEEEIVR
jgi:tetratricopeptide (TPR) repeat protein